MYFSNNDQWDAAVATLCRKCANNKDSGCQIEFIHRLYNGDDGDAGEILEILWPKGQDCKMFTPSNTDCTSDEAGD